MGQSMALNLRRSGIDLIVFDLNPAAAVPLIEAGAVLASSVGEVARQSNVVFTSLPGPPEVELVVLGTQGILENAAPGLTLIDLSTSSLSLARRMYDAFAAKGAFMLDAPISGGPGGAASRELAIWVGGDRDVYDRHLDLLQRIGNAPRYIGQIGAGTVTKLTHNMLAQTILLAMAEAFSMAVKGGVDPLELWDALKSGSVGRGSCLNLLNNQFLPGKFDPAAFALKLAFKDLTLATALGEELGVPLPMSNITLREMTEAMDRGFADRDMRAFLTLQLERAGVSIAVPPERIQERMKAS